MLRLLSIVGFLSLTPATVLGCKNVADEVQHNVKLLSRQNCTAKYFAIRDLIRTSHYDAALEAIESMSRSHRNDKFILRTKAIALGRTGATERAIETELSALRSKHVCRLFIPCKTFQDSESLDEALAYYRMASYYPTSSRVAKTRAAAYADGKQLQAYLTEKQIEQRNKGARLIYVC